MKKKIIDNWEICKPGDKGLYAFDGLSYLDDELSSKPIKDDSFLIYQEQKLILDMLKLFITEEYGYYFSEVHTHEEPEELDSLEFKRLYYTPVDFYHKSGEYNCIDVAYTEDYTYYAISLHGCSFASALTEYVRVAKQ